MAVFEATLSVAEWNSDEYQCDFKFSSAGQYTCEINDAFARSNVTKAKHWSGKTALDVENVNFVTLLGLEVPRDFLQKFPNANNVTLEYLHLFDLNQGQFDGSDKVESFSIFYSDIERVGPNAFIFVRNLKRLRLYMGRIEYISHSGFDGLHKLEFLDIGRNKLKSINYGMFNNLINLQTIETGENPIVALQPGIFKYNRKLTKIYLDICDIEYINPKFIEELQPGTLLNLKVNFCISDIMIIPNPAFVNEYERMKKEQDRVMEKIKKNCSNFPLKK